MFILREDRVTSFIFFGQSCLFSRKVGLNLYILRAILFILREGRVKSFVFFGQSCLFSGNVVGYIFIFVGQSCLFSGKVVGYIFYILRAILFILREGRVKSFVFLRQSCLFSGMVGLNPLYSSGNLVFSP